MFLNKINVMHRRGTPSISAGEIRLGAQSQKHKRLTNVHINLGMDPTTIEGNPKRDAQFQ